MKQRYFDKNNEEITTGMTIVHDDGDTERIYETVEGDLGINADNPDYAYADNVTPKLYPLYQFDMSEWAILKSNKK